MADIETWETGDFSPLVRKVDSVSLTNSGENLEKIEDGNSNFALLCTAVSTLGPFSFGYTLGFTSPSLLDMQNELQLSSTEASIFSAVVSVGAMVGAVIAGSLADKYGRKFALASASILYTLGWIVIGISKEFLLLSFGRVLTGLATGVVSFAVPVYIAEISPSHLRGSLGALNQLALTFGLLGVYTLGLTFKWRSLALIGVIPALSLLSLLFFIAESPRWLAKCKGEEQVTQALTQLRGKGADVSVELAEIHGSIRESQALPAATFADLSAPSLRKPLIISIGLMVLQQLSGVNAVMFFAGAIFKQAGFSDPNLPGCFIQAVQVLATGVAVSLMDRAGRRVLLMVSAGGLALGLFLLSLAFWLQGISVSTFVVSLSSSMALASLLVYIVSFSAGMGAIPWIIMSEVFPAHVRGMAGGLAVLVNWTSCFVVTLSFGFLLDWNAAGAFFLYGLECLFTVLFVALLVPETRGRSLEQIEASFRT